MPLPDATPDKRIYELLKTVDLENLTFSDLQAVGQTIYAEQGAEDELRRLILLNLARLSVVGEWTGLTSAGASGFTGMVSEFAGGGVDTFTLARQPIYGASHDVDSTTNANQYEYAAAYPFIAPKTGTVSEMSLQVNTIDTTGATIRMAIYDTTSTNLPNSLLGYGDFTMLSTGTEIQTSFSATISLTEGEVYFFVANTDQAGSNGAIAAQGVSGLPMTMGIGTGPGDLGKICFRHTAGGKFTLPDPYVANLMGTTSYARPNFGLNIT